ncbi:SHD1 domain-containing protein [Pontiella agarivorans]|uniref:SHD1 domain-containing protein n=1 Tax=Pontiella agarivorans TaxID=3038953 RepID=A0ABU5N1M6_9BACT|nr:SHD1 domain-containing protein [Pontiella agarivorans]MDZ8120337.1 SHD1 domain-containing protein [Pontiella agarivorans]
MNRLILSFLGMALTSLMARAEVHVWTLKHGKTVEAEYVALAAGEVTLKTVRGRIRKVPLAGLCKEDRRYIELLNPPRLDLELGKTSDQRVYPPTYNESELPRQTIYTFTARVKQLSGRPYHRPLTLEFFNIGEENNGDKNILYSYQKESFTLNGNGSEFTVSTQEIPVTAYVSYGQRRGESYSGYMMVVKDERGEIIASKATRNEWLEIADKLCDLPVGRTFDPETGERCWPTRPSKFY